MSHADTPDQKLVVNEGYKGTISISKTHLKLEWAGDMESYFAWMEGRLVFKEESLKDVFAQIERWYDVQIEIPEPDLPILEKKFSADLKTRSVREVMSVIQWPWELSSSSMMIESSSIPKAECRCNRIIKATIITTKTYTYENPYVDKRPAHTGGDGDHLILAAHPGGFSKSAFRSVAA